MALWTPSNLGTTKCVAWFDASSISVADGAAVETWTSSEGNSVSATQTTAAKRPLYVESSTVSGKPALAFDGSSSDFDHLLFTDSDMNVGTTGSLLCCFIGNANDSTSLSFGVLTRGDNSAKSIQLLYQNNDAGIQISVGTVSDVISNSNFPAGTTGTDYRSLVFGRHSDNLMMRYIGDELSDQADASSIDLSTTNYAIGSAYFSGGAQGEIAEMIYLSGLSVSEIQQVEGYAAHKYGLTASLSSDHPYKNFPPTFTLPTVYWIAGGNPAAVDDPDNWSDNLVPDASKKCVFNDTASVITTGTLTAGEVRFSNGFEGNFGTAAAPLDITTDVLSINAPEASVNVDAQSIADIYIGGNGRGVHVEGTATDVTVESKDPVTLSLTSIQRLEVRHDSGAGGVISTQSATNAVVGYGGNVEGNNDLSGVKVYEGGYLFQHAGSDINGLQIFGGSVLFHGTDISRTTNKIWGGILTIRGTTRHQVDLDDFAIYNGGTLDLSDSPIADFSGNLTVFGGKVVLGDGYSVAIS